MRLAILSTLLLLATACPSGGGAADRQLDRRGFPGDGEVLGTPPPACTAPNCWAVDVGRMNLGMAPDHAGGISGITVAWPSGEISIEHIDTTGVVDRSEPLSQGYSYELAGTGDGGFLLLVPTAIGSVLGETLSGSGGVVLKVAADWTVEWSVTVPARFPQNLHVRGSRIDGGGLLHHVNGGPGGTTDRVDYLTRFDADGSILWEQHAPTLGKIDLADNDDWVDVNTVIDESVVRKIIPQLKAAGARGIVEYPLNKVID